MEHYKKLSLIDEDKLQNDYEKYIKILNEKNSIESKLEILKSEIKSTTSHLKDLDKYKYDPSCEFCIKNGQEQIKNKNELSNKLSDIFKDNYTFYLENGYVDFETY